MAEVKKKNTSKTTKTSKVQGNSSKKKQVSQLSSDELMEQILNKKKNKSVKSSTNVVKKKASSKKVDSKKKVENISSDELYEMIKAKKKKKATTTKKDTIKEKNKSEVKNKIEVTKKSKQDLSSDELYDLIKSKKNKSKSTSKKEIVEPKKEEKKTSKEDLIITREITFTEDKLDLKDKKLLKELHEAIKEFDSLDDTAPVPVVEDKPKKFNKVLLLKILAIIGLIFIVILLFSLFRLLDVDNPKVINKEKNKDIIEVIDERPVLYEECLARPLDENDKNEIVINAENELTNYLADNYDVSLIYEDLSLGFSYSYNPDEVYYAASTIKSLGALYIYTKAASGVINLDETVKYTSKFVWGSSRKMKNHKLGEEISLRTLVEYSITVSDNSAHQMLVSYIGRNNLKEFGKSLGAQYTLYGSDNFGHITATDAIIYMKAINDFINNNGELGLELKSYFVEADQNGLKFEDLGIEAAHKFGEYAPYYHDIGIVYDENPYVIAILTSEKSGDYQSKIKDINKRVYDLHKLYYSNRESFCYTQVYGS